MTNELIDEVREARAALAAEHGYDRQRIYEWARTAHTARKQALRNPIPSDLPHSTSEAVASGEPLAVSK